MIDAAARPISRGSVVTAVCALALIAGIAVFSHAQPSSQVSMWTLHELETSKLAPDYHHRDLGRYLAQRGECSWYKLDKLAGPIDGFTHVPYAERHLLAIDGMLDLQYNQFIANRPYLMKHGMYRCKQYHSDTSFTFIDRLGPFETEGGEDWVSMWFSDIGGLSQLKGNVFLTAGGYFAMTGAGMSTLDDLPKPDDRPMGHPPINPHHWHLNTGPNWEHRNEADQYVLYQVHSDNSQCADAVGIGCYGFEFPPDLGFGVKKDQFGNNMLWTTGSWLDVRKPNSPKMVHWLEFTGTVTLKEPRVSVDTFALIGVPWPMGLQLTLPREEYLSYRNNPKWSEHFNEMLFMVPASGGSLYWTSLEGAQGSDCATITSWRWHQHGRHMLEGMWLMHGSSKELRLGEMLKTKEINVEVYTGMFITGAPGNAVPLAPTNHTIAGVQSYLKGTGNFICEFPLEHPQKWQAVVEDDFWPGVRGKDYPRHVKPSGLCPAVTLYPGDALTTVSFYNPPASLSSLIDLDYTGLMTGQHGMLEAFQLNGVCDREKLARMKADGLGHQANLGWHHEW